MEPSFRAERLKWVAAWSTFHVFCFRFDPGPGLSPATEAELGKIIGGQGSPWPKWAGGAPEKMAPPHSPGAPKTQACLVLRGSEKSRISKNPSKNVKNHFLLHFYYRIFKQV